MKLIERFRAHLADKALQRLRDQLKQQSLDPQGPGCITHDAFPETFFVLGTILVLNAKTMALAYSPGYLERQYIALKASLARHYPGFSPDKVKLEINVDYAAILVADSALMDQAEPVLQSYKYADDQTKIVEKLIGLEIPVVFDGDEITLRISHDCYVKSKDFGFLVAGHPDGQAGKEVWCLANPDYMSTLHGEKTL